MQFFEILERGQNFMEDKKIIIFYLSQNGEKIAQSLLPLFKHTEIFKLNGFLISQNWNKNTKHTEYHLLRFINFISIVTCFYFASLCQKIISCFYLCIFIHLLATDRYLPER